MKIVHVSLNNAKNIKNYYRKKKQEKKIILNKHFAYISVIILFRETFQMIKAYLHN